MDWENIKTAPKDETVILLFFPESVDTDGVRVGWWFEDGFDWGWFDDEAASKPMTELYGEPTHWMPIPLKPIA